MKSKFFLVPIASILLSVSPVIAQDNPNENRAGLTCEQILARGKKSWEEYYYQATGNSSMAATDTAYLTYAECHRERNNKKLAALPNSTQQKIKKYRQLYKKYRVSYIGLQGNYAGGGTAYGHAMAQTETLDEEFVETLIKLHSESKSSNNVNKKEVERKVKNMRNKITKQNPNLAKNRKKFVLPDYIKYGIASYADLENSFNALSAMLLKENSKTGLAILNFMDKANNIFR